MIKQQTGVSLIEVMVSLFIIALGLFGLAALQSRTLIYNQSAYQRTIAADLANDLAERIRANRTPFLAVSDDASATLLPNPPDFTKCTAVTLSAASATCNSQASGTNSYLLVSDMSEWFQSLRTQLPNGSFTLTSTPATSSGFLRYTLTISWLDDHAASATANYTVAIE